MLLAGISANASLNNLSSSLLLLGWKGSLLILRASRNRAGTQKARHLLQASSDRCIGPCTVYSCRLVEKVRGYHYLDGTIVTRTINSSILTGKLKETNVRLPKLLFDQHTSYQHCGIKSVVFENGAYTPLKTCRRSVRYSLQILKPNKPSI